MWTSNGHVADYCEILVRTDPDAAKHKGITWLIMAMDSPGIDVRPLRTIAGSTEFCEMFLDAVRVPKTNRVGAENDSWRVGNVTLSFERGTGLVREVVRSVEMVRQLAEWPGAPHGISAWCGMTSVRAASWATWLLTSTPSGRWPDATSRSACAPGRSVSAGRCSRPATPTSAIATSSLVPSTSTGSWEDLLCDAKRRAMRPPVVMVGDAALGMWAALREVFPETRQQRCWVDKAANVLCALPQSMHPCARKALGEIRDAQDRAHAEKAIKAFEAEFKTKWPKAAAKIVDDAGVLLTFFDFPAEHWLHLKTTNPIESTFATVRLRTKVTKGPGSKAAGLAMAFKLIEAAQARWRAVNAPHLVALVRAGAVFRNGVLVERHDNHAETTDPAGVAA